jgi:hypothetical protein
MASPRELDSTTGVDSIEGDTNWNAVNIGQDVSNRICRRRARKQTHLTVEKIPTPLSLSELWEGGISVPRIESSQLMMARYELELPL